MALLSGPRPNERRAHFGLEHIEQRAMMQVSSRRAQFFFANARGRTRVGGVGWRHVGGVMLNVEKPAFSTGLAHLAPCCGFEEPRVGAGVGFDAFLRAAVGLHIVCWVWDLAFAVPSLL